MYRIKVKVLHHIIKNKVKVLKENEICMLLIGKDVHITEKKKVVSYTMEKKVKVTSCILER